LSSRGGGPPCSYDRYPGGRTTTRADVLVKHDIYRSIALRWDVVRAHDDNPNVIALWEHLGIPVNVVPGWTDPVPAIS
jgi:hypothetical protein